MMMMIALKGKREKKKHTLISVFRSPDHDFIVASYYCHSKYGMFITESVVTS